MKDLIPILGYLRVSGASQIERDGFPRQLAAIQSYCAAKGFYLVQVFEERGVSGTLDLDQRPALQNLYARLEETGIVHIIVEKLDRVARDLMVQETIMGDLNRKGIELISTAEPDLCGNDPSRVLIRQIFGALAQWDRAMINMRMNGARKRIRDSGGKAEGVYPYGEDPKRPEEAETLALMLYMRKEGDTYDRIAHRLNTLGWRGREGGEWKMPTVGKILRRH